MDKHDKEVLEYMLLTDELISEYKEASAEKDKRIANLEGQVTVLQNSQKEASAVSKPTFPVDMVSTTIDKCVEAGFIHMNEKVAHIEVIERDPSKALELLTKLAAGTIEASNARSIGTVVEKTAHSCPSSGKTLNESKSESDLFYEQKFQV